jgi:hypothetical protein
MNEERVLKMQYTEEFKIEAVRRLEIPVATLENWMHRRRVAAPVEAGAAVPTSISHPAAELEAEVSRLRRELPNAKLDIKILSKSDNGVLREGVAVKYAWIDLYRDQYSVSRPCRLLSISRSGYCRWRVHRPSLRTLAKVALDKQVAVIHANSRGTYGRPRIVRQLEQQSFHVRVDRLTNSGCHEGNTKGGMSCCTWNRGKVNASLVLRPRASDRCPQPCRRASSCPGPNAVCHTSDRTRHQLHT